MKYCLLIFIELPTRTFNHRNGLQP
uniref:Uncharacterized protein n=1 Tax=Anguilla anguilla TaxID=7936 RepID=A0A0E9RIL8_ANGAN